MRRTSSSSSFLCRSSDGFGAEGGRPGLRSVPDQRTMGGPSEETQTETEEGAGEDREERAHQVR